VPPVAQAPAGRDRRQRNRPLPAVFPGSGGTGGSSRALRTV